MRFHPSRHARVGFYSDGDDCPVITRAITILSFTELGLRFRAVLAASILRERGDV